jgi:hypothetical protein
MKALQSQHAIMQQIPVEGLQMTDVENDAMTLGNGAVVKRVGMNDGKQFVSLAASIANPIHQRMRSGEVAE